VSDPSSFDARPLVEPIDRRDVRAFTKRLRETGALSSGAGAIFGIVVVVAIVGVFVAVFGGIFASAIAGIASSGRSTPFALMSFVPLLFIGGIVAVILVAVVRRLRGGGSRRYRLDRFARANGMSYVPALSNPRLPGMIFGIGSSRRASDLVRGERPRFVEFANYRYTTGSGKNRTTHRWGYVAVKLDVPLPHIVLDAVGNNGLFGSNLPASFAKGQRLSLEGDFDRYFALYCPEGYERDALYLFTPDIMARFIDNAAALDVEIVDDWLFLYAKRDFSTLDPAMWAWLFSVVAALLDKLAQWARWRDERLRAAMDASAAAESAGAERGADRADAATAAPSASATTTGVPFAAPAGQLRPPPGVASQGRRLKRGVPVVTFVAIGIFILVWLLQNGLFGLFR